MPKRVRDAVVDDVVDVDPHFWIAKLENLRKYVVHNGKNDFERGLHLRFRVQDDNQIRKFYNHLFEAPWSRLPVDLVQSIFMDLFAVHDNDNDEFIPQKWVKVFTRLVNQVSISPETVSRAMYFTLHNPTRANWYYDQLLTLKIIPKMEDR